MYETGNGVTKDPARAFAYAKSGERSGNAWIVGRLVEYYLTGIGTPVDRKTGIALYERAAQLGNRGAVRDLGDIYRFAKYRVPRDFALARKWYSRGMRWATSIRPQPWPI